MADNPIKYSDLVQPDDSITNAINQLKELMATYIETMKGIKAEAEKVAKSISGVSGATDQGRKSITQGATEAQRLQQAYVDLQLAQGKCAEEIAKLKYQQQEANRYNKESAKLAEAQAGSYNALSVEYSRLKRELNNVSAEERKNNQVWREKEKRAREVYEQMKKLQEATGKYALNVGNYAESFKKAFSELKQGKDVMGNLNTMMTSLGGGGLKMAIGGIVKLAGVMGAGVVATKVFKDAFFASEENLDAWNSAVRQSQTAYEAFLTHLNTGDISGYLSRIGEIVNAAKEAYKELDRLSTQKAINNKAYQIQMSENERFSTMLRTGRYVAPLDGRKATMKQGQLLTDDQLKKIATQLDQGMTKVVGIIRDQVAQTTNSIDSMYEEQSKILGMTKEQFLKGTANMDAFDKMMKGYDSYKEFERKKNLAILKSLKRWRLSKEEESILNNPNNPYAKYKGWGKFKDDGEKFAKINSLINEREQSKNQIYSQYGKIYKAMNKVEGNGNSGSNGKGGTSTIVATTDAEYKALIKAKREYEDLILSMEQDGAEKQIKIIENTYNRKNEDLTYQLTNEKNLTIQQREIINNTILANEQKRDKEVEAIRTKQAEDEAKRVLEEQKNLKESALKEFDTQQKLAQSEFDLLESTEEQKTKFKLQAEKERLQKVLELNEKYGKTMSEAEIEITQNTIKKLDQELTNGKKKTEEKDIYAMIGLKLDNDQRRATQESVQYVTQQLSSILDSYMQIAEKEYESAKTNTDNAKNALQLELEARANGYASNVQNAQKNLALAQKEEKEKLKIKEKYQKAQEQLETAQQAVSLITASANIWQSMSGIPIVGPALAVASIATMWASFAASKIKANQLTKDMEYGEGGYEFLEGGSHQSGNDIDMGKTKDGKRRRAEGGEAFAIFNKTATRKYRGQIPDIVNAINHGMFEERFGKAFANNFSILSPSVSVDTKNLERDVAEIRRQGERNTSYVGNTKIVRYKNLTRIVRA